ncbi:MAG: STAS domain-containing protein [Chthoniobacterales bacterium]|nr:STAS domain-containing protein [Chthoniobacterales bacterium]
MQSSIQVGVNGPVVWVRVAGRGSFLESGSLKEFGREMVNRGHREFVFDLEECVMMDSTFMGTMAGMALRLKELGQGRLHVINCGERSRELLSGLGLDQIFDIQAKSEAAPKCEALTTANGQAPEDKAEKAKREQASTMLEAHEALCEARPENLTRFKDVLEYLKQDVRHESPAK